MERARADATVAKKRGITAQVHTKEKPKAPWLPVGEVLADLVLALELARSLDVYESSVITSGPGPYTGFIYWTSRHPDALTSSVLTDEIEWGS